MVDVLAQLPGATCDRLGHPGADLPARRRVGREHRGLAGRRRRADATFVGRVGDDAFGRMALDELARRRRRPRGERRSGPADRDLHRARRSVAASARWSRRPAPTPAWPPLPAGRSATDLHVSGYAVFHGRGRGRGAGRDGRAPDGRRPVSVDAASAAPLHAFGAERFLDWLGRALLFANDDEAAR